MGKIIEKIFLKKLQKEKNQSSAVALSSHSLPLSHEGTAHVMGKEETTTTTASMSTCSKMCNLTVERPPPSPTLAVSLVYQAADSSLLTRVKPSHHHDRSQGAASDIDGDVWKTKSLSKSCGDTPRPSHTHTLTTSMHPLPVSSSPGSEPSLPVDSSTNQQ